MDLSFQINVNYFFSLLMSQATLNIYDVLLWTNFFFPKKVLWIKEFSWLKKFLTQNLYDQKIFCSTLIRPTLANLNLTKLTYLI